jgi:signal transduction histidine kinase/CheY-like chemotaxis protein
LLNHGYWSGESRLRHFKTGKAIEVEITAFQICDDSGAPLYFATVARDITERKRSEAERARLEEQLFQAQKMESIGRLAGGVAHDFNNLLTVINGYSGLLLSDTFAGSARNVLGEILKAGERATGLTRQLLAFSRKQALQPRTLDLNRVVLEMRPMLERLVGEDLEMCVVLRPDSGNVHADPHQLEQVIMNLVVNARDAMPGGGRLSIETAPISIETSPVERDESYARRHAEVPAGRYVMLEVSDSGVGIDEETRQRMFEPFFTTKGTGMGTGLGLSTVQGIVAQSGGHITVDSEPGIGTTFRIYLPAQEQAEDGMEETAPARAVGGRETVLVVEDQAAVREFAVAALKAYGYRVIQAESAGEALLLCEREERIDLLLTDVVMPNLSGQNLAGSLRRRRPGIKVLFMSGYNETRVLHHGALDEDAHFIEKPFSPEALACKVRAVLGPPAAGARILVADDEEGVRGFLRMVLEEGGYEVLEAEDGKDALRRALSDRVDLITTDLVMLEQDGVEAIQALRREVPGTGLIAISGAYEGKLLEMARLLDADAMLSKPVSAELLLATVAEVLKPRARLTSTNGRTAHDSADRTR